MRRCLLLLSALLLAPDALAAPILTATPSSSALSPTQTVLTLSVDPHGTPVAALDFDLSSLSAGLQILAVQSLNPEVGAFGPTSGGGTDQAGFVGSFFVDQITPFDVGTLTVMGLVAGTALVASGNFTDGAFNDIVFGPTDVAVVAAPEPGTAALIGLGLALLVARRRSRG